jgi:hypothetical protein
MGIRLIALMLLPLGLNAYACPQGIIGNYRCTSADATEILVITQVPGQTNTTFVINDDEIVVDNEDHEITDDPTFRHATIHNSCTSSAIRREVIGDFYNGQKKIGAIDIVTEYSIVDGSLVETTSGNQTNAINGTGLSLDEKIVCTRDP